LERIVFWTLSCLNRTENRPFPASRRAEKRLASGLRHDAIFETDLTYEEANAWRDMMAAIQWHQAGDWGDLPEEDRQENELSLQQGFRLLSAYSSAQGVRFWIITEGDRSVTTVLLPEDY